MRIGLLGPLAVETPAGEPIAVGGLRQRTLLALLALRAGVTVRADRLIEDLWAAQSPVRPANALQIVVFKLRRALGADLVVTASTGYQLAIDGDDVDAHRFEALLHSGRTALLASRYDVAISTFDQALALWRDDPLLEFADCPGVAAAASNWHELRATATEDRFEALLSVGHHAQIVAELQRAILVDPFRERLRGQLMVALYRAGRQAEALRAFRDARHALAEELGIDPSPELRRLERAILDQDPMLAAVPAPSTPTGSAETGERRIAVDAGVSRTVGRDPELAVLRAGVGRAVDGRRGLTLVVGEAGIGKTRLVEDVAADAADLGAAVVWGRCHSGRGAPAFWPWIQVIRETLGRVDADALGFALDTRAGVLAQLVPEVRDLVVDASPPPPTDPDSANFRLADAIASYLRALASSRPLLVALDDVHWADNASIDVIVLALSAGSDAAIQFVATARTSTSTTDTAFERALVDLQRLPHVERIDLEGLDATAVAELVNNGGLDMKAESITRLVRRTRGNPFFVTEIIKLASRQSGTVGTDVESGVPASVRTVIRQRLDQLPDDTSTLLTAAAILGEDVDPILLATMTGTSAVSVLQRLQPAVDAAILVPLGGPARRYAFAHGLVADTITAAVTGAAHAQLHAQAARTLEAHHRSAPGPHLISVANHWFQAVPIAPIDDAIDAALRASRWAVSHVAHRQAEEQLRTALDLIAGIEDDQQRTARELEVLDQLSGLLLIGAGYAAPGLPELFDRMRQLSHVTENRELLLGATWRLSIYYCTIVQIDAAIDLGEALLARGDREDEPLIQLVGHLALSTPNILRAEFHEARRHLDAALEMCRSGYDMTLQGVMLETPGVWARSFSGWNCWLLGETQLAESLSREAIAVGEQSGHDSYAVAVALCIASWVAALEGDAELVRSRCTDGIARANAAGYDVRVFMMIVEGWAIAALGDFAAGTAQLSEVSEAMRMAGATMLRPFHFALLADAACRHGRFDEALAHADRGLEIAASTGERWGESELHRLRSGAIVAIEPSNTIGARSELELAVAIATRQGAGAFLERARRDLAAFPP